MIDFYSELREPAYNSNLPARDSSFHAGRFDPLLSLVLLHSSIEQHLDSQKGALPSISVEAGGSHAVRAYATSLHETIHWWQHIGSTIGLLSGLTTAAQAATCIHYMSELGVEAPKPLLGVLEAKRYKPTQEDHPAWRAALRWREAELGNAFLLNPAQAFARVKNNSFLYESIGHSIAMHHYAVTWYVSQIADNGGSVFPSADDWIDLYERSRKDRRVLFEPNQRALLPFGAKHLFEGQARLSELQYFDRAVESRTMAEFKQLGLLEETYAKCLNYFLETIELPMPNGVQSPEINLFLLLCDFAINPADGYPLAIPESLDLIHENHPGIRFTRLCATARDHKEKLLSTVTYPSYGSYCEAAAILAEELNWLSPDEVAKQVQEKYRQTSSGEKLLDERFKGDFGVLDVPAKFVLTEHISFAESKAGCPHVFCWPGNFLTTDQEDDSPDVEAVKDLLDHHSPPFHASSEVGSVNSVSIHGLTTAQAKNVADRYFQNQATVDLFRQWISHKNGTSTNEFVYQFDWKPDISDSEIGNLKDSFRATFGLDIDTIQRLT